MQLFWAALLSKLRHVVTQRDYTTIIMYNMYDIVTAQERERERKQPVSATDNEDSKNEDNEVAPFKCWWTNQGARPKTSNRAGHAQNLTQSRPSSNANQNGKFCYFCKIQGHRQEECWKRIWENIPSKKARMSLLAQSVCDGQKQWQQWKLEKGTAAGFSFMSLKNLLIQTPSIIPQLILSLCTISITTCNKLLKSWCLSMGTKLDQDSQLEQVIKLSHSWLFDTGVAVTCMNKQLFDLALDI